MASEQRAAPGPGFDVVLRTHRLRAGLTQEELAARAAIGVRTVRDLERGRASRPQRTTAELLAAALGLAGAERETFLTAARGRLGGLLADTAATTGAEAGAAANGEPTRADGPGELEEEPPVSIVQLPLTDRLFGRDEELAELAARLADPDGPRVVTLVGTAGVGKTSLAIEVARRAATAFPGGVAGIAIDQEAPLSEPLGAVAAAFSVNRADDLPGHFAGRAALLVVDGVEHGPHTVAEALTVLLARLPALRFLATGRHPIGLAAESVRPVVPLETAPDPPPGTLEELSAYAAVALFLERLSRVRRTRLESREIAPLAALVRRLGGLPLAIELAAARGRVLTMPEMLNRYGVYGQNRTSGGPLPLREAVADTYRLLTPAEQHALRRLAAFNDRWSLEMAENMLADGPELGTDVVHLLDRLLALGLLGVSGSRTVRFRLVEVVRDFAIERAAAEGDLRGSRIRHARVLADLVERIAPRLGRMLPEAIVRLDDMTGDMGAALSWAVGEEPHTALRLAAALPRWWRLRGREVVGEQWLRRLLADPRTADADPVIRAWARAGLARLSGDRGVAFVALSEFEQLGSVDGRLVAHGLLAGPGGGTAEARRHGEAALALARETGRRREAAIAERRLARHEVRAGDLGAARRRLAEAERLAGECADRRLRASVLVSLAEVARLDDRPAEAVRVGQAVLTEQQRAVEAEAERRLLATIGMALAETDRLAEAAEVLTGLRPFGDGTPDGEAPDGAASLVEGAIALRRGEPKRAAECFGRACEVYEGGDPRPHVTALVGLIASVPDHDDRVAAVRRLAELCRETGVRLLPRDRDALGPETVSRVLMP
ncbi:helix-turn-helix domain-containing protein [Actinoplanes sp. NPDC051851]|uniref:ATP-binding protein n=1 Tax=Actinoplanes sp. NPDC051851 TaxID=3154753 RepID=UPI0034313E1A